MILQPQQLSKEKKPMKTQALVFIALSSASMLSAAQTNQNNYQYQQDQQDSNFQQTPRTVMDDEIARDIHGVLNPSWISSGYPDVSFDVKNGIVNLRGVVDSNKEKIKIEQSIKSIDGVKRVNNTISIGLNPPASKSLTAANNSNAKNSAASSNSPGSKDTGTNENDRQINKKIREKINKWSPKGYETIVIASSNGVVTVTGNVERVQDIQKISNDVKSIEGVKGINNQVSIKKRNN
jgi:osmotically-inducible protein OsmY